MKRFLSLLMMMLVLVISAIASAVDSPVSITDQVASCIDNDVGSSVFIIDDYMPSRDISALQTQHNLKELHSQLLTILGQYNMQSQNIAIITIEGPMCKNKIPNLSTVLFVNYINICELYISDKISNSGILNHDYEYG